MIIRKGGKVYDTDKTTKKQLDKLKNTDRALFDHITKLKQNELYK
jgi:hypothetical protein